MLVYQLSEEFTTVGIAQSISEYHILVNSLLDTTFFLKINFFNLFLFLAALGLCCCARAFL